MSIIYEYKLSASEITSEPSVMEWTPDGKYLIVAYKGGTIRYLEKNDFENHNMKISLKDAHQPGKISESTNRDPNLIVEGICISHDSKFFATRDSSNGVCLFKRDYKFGDTWDPVEWIFSGKILSHEVGITGICFGESLDENEQNKLWLFSIGRD